MSRTDLGDEQVKADVLNRLLRRRCWGAKYLPVQSLVNWIGRNIKNNGDRARKAIGELVKSNLLVSHKGGNTILESTKKKRNHRIHRKASS